MSYAFNPFTGTLDRVNDDINQLPIGDSDTYLKWVAPDTVQLLVNGSVAHTWTVTAPATSGMPIGLLLSLTRA
jgi:hypothetical protein